MPFVADSPPEAGRFVPDTDVLKAVKDGAREQRRPKESPTSAKNIAGAAIEPNLSLLTGMVSGPLSGFAGIAGAALPGPPGQGADWQRKVAEKGTYSPKTEGGRNAVQALSYLPHKIEEAGRWTGGKAQDMGAPPWLATGIDTGIESLAGIPLGMGLRKGMNKLDSGVDSLVRSGPLQEMGLVNPAPKPRGSENVRALAGRDIRLTPGMMLGGGWDTTEQAISKVPFIGAPIKSARAGAVEDFNREAWNDSLKPVGGALPKNVKGQAAAEYVRTHLQENYDKLVERATAYIDGPPKPPAPKNALPAPGQIGAPPPAAAPTLRQRLDSLVQLASGEGGLQPRELRVLRSEVKRSIGAFGKDGRATGEGLQNLLERLRTQGEQYRTANDGYQRNLGMAMKQLEAEIRASISEQNPKLAKDWRANDDAWARYKIAERASVAAGAKEGVFPPSAYSSAVKAKDRTKDKRAYSEGNARQQDLSDPAKSVLSDTMRDSGTPMQLAIFEALLGGGGSLIGGPGTIAAMMASPLMYSRPGLSLMQRMILGEKPKFGAGLGERLEDIAGLLPQQGEQR